MAIVYPLATGNWSTINWQSGGSAYGQLPQPGDDVYADGKTVTIDQNINVANLYTTTRSGGTAGGGFTLTGDYNITANITAGSSYCVTSTHTGTISIIGNLTGSATTTVAAFYISSGPGNVNITGNISLAGPSGSRGIYLLGSGLINITGNATHTGTGAAGAVNVGGTSRVVMNGILTSNGSSASTCVAVTSASSSAFTFTGSYVSISGYGIINSGSGTAVINADYTVTGASAQYFVHNSGTGITTINGNITGSPATSTGYALYNSGSGTLNINGNVIAGAVTPSSTFGIVQNNTTGTINIVGNVTGGSVANTIAVSLAAAGGTLNITGTATGGSNATNTPAVYSSTGAIVNIIGSCVAGAHPAVNLTNVAGDLRLQGNITYTNGIVPYYAWSVLCDPTAAQTITIQDTSNTSRTLATSNISNGAPVPTDVRYGIIYGSTNELTGTLKVPDPSNVRKDVPTDNTVGTANLTASDFWNALTTSLTTTNSIGERLKNCSTVDTVGNQITAI